MIQRVISCQRRWSGRSKRWVVSAAMIGALLSPITLSGAELVGRIVDSETRQALAARVYLQSESGDWLFVQSADSEGSALPYQEQWVPMSDSIEQHTTVSPHPFKIELSPGTYRLTIEKGKEYLPLTRTIEIKESDLELEFLLQRFDNLATRGWYSGETHVHRRLRELPNVMLAEDLNVAFPVAFWTTESDRVPDLEPSTLRRQGPSPFGPREDRGYDPIAVDATHVIFPRNTEYEIFAVGDQRHVLGAVFILNHKNVFRQTMPPVSKIAAQAHAEGALLDLDKHSWPWSLMLVPVAGVDLYELSNNSVWRTNFGFRTASVPPPAFMEVETEGQAMTELGWLQYGFETYYALLNCGFRLKPTAGTASGVHPVPLGHSRVYVHLDGEFSASAWLEGLKAGRSFVTTGPLLEATVNGQHAGHTFSQQAGESTNYRVTARISTADQLERFEVLLNGQWVNVDPATRQAEGNGRAILAEFDLEIPVDESCWLAVRCFTRTTDDRVRFAHTAPWYVQVGEQPILPRREQIDFLIGRMRDEIQRNQGVISDDALAEFQQALEIYQAIGRQVAESAR